MLLEREHAIEQFTQAANGNLSIGKVLLLSGEAGIGKTTLLEHMRTQLNTKLQLIWSGCDPLFTPRPYAPIHDLANLLSPDLLPLLEQSASPSKIFSTFYHAISQLTQPTMLIIEDVHWADNATLDLLKYLVRRISFVPCILCLSYRDDELEIDHPLRSMLSLIPSAHSIRIPLAQLSVNAVTQLAKDSTHDPMQLHKITGGNPFFISELLANKETDTRTVPASIKDTIGVRLSKLAPKEQHLLQTLSLIPYSVPVSLIQALFNEEGETYAMACVARKLLQCDSKGEFRFRHELTRLAIGSFNSANQQKQAHTRILEHLESLHLDENLAWLVHHSQGAFDAQRVLKYAPIAARNAANLGAHKEAASFYSKALKYAESATTELAATLYENWAYEVGLTTIMDQSVIDARRHAIALWRALNRKEKIGENLRWLSRLYWYQGQAERAEHYANEAISIFESIPASSELAMAYSMRSQLDMLNDRTELAVVWGNKALKLDKSFSNPVVRAHALNNIGTALLMRGKTEGESLLNESLALAQQHGLHEDAARVYTNYSDYCVRFKKLDLAEELISKGIGYDVSHDLDSWTYYLVGIQAGLRLEQGRLVDAETIANGVQGMPSQTLLMKLPALTVLARARSRMGAPDAKALLEQALENARATDENQYVIPARLGLIEHIWLSSPPFVQDNPALKAHFTWLMELDSGVLNKWQLGELCVWLKRCNIDVTAQNTNTLEKPFALELAGKFREAFEAWQSLKMPFNAGMSLIQTTEEDFRHAASQAWLIFEEMEAKAPLQWLRMRANDLGQPQWLPKARRGPYSKTRQHPMGLTAKEQQVLKLLVTGASNQEIANTLSRSNRTIENHVSSILSKLNVENRMEAMLRVQSEPWLSA